MFTQRPDGRKCRGEQECAPVTENTATAGTAFNRHKSGSCVRTRVGIELTPVACRIVQVAERGRVSRDQNGDTVVHSFGVWPASGADTAAALASLRGRVAAVVVWGTASQHRQVQVTPGSYEEMRTQALRALFDAGVPTRGAWADIAPVGPASGARRRVLVTIAAAPAMAAAVQPLVDAGIRVHSAITPAAALAAIARSRRASSVPDAIEAYVALEETATCIALMRGGVLMAARDLSWGFLDERDGGLTPRRREDIAARIGDELADFFATYEQAGRVSQVCICGGVPDLRSTTLPLMERFDAEVETLDSLFGIDAASLPEPANEFRERAPELRLAWAAAAGWTTINLLRARRRRLSHAALSRAAVIAGLAAGLAGGWCIAQSDVLTATAPRPLRHVAANTSPLVPPLLAQIALPVIRTPDLQAVHAEPPRIAQEPPAVAQEPPPAALEPPPIRQEPRSSISLAPPVILSAPPLSRPAPAVVPRVARSSSVRAARPHVVVDLPPFAAVLESILFSPDRQLAIVDGRVVGRGDDVRGATVVEITAGAVIVRDLQGRLRRLASGASRR
jgi:hypothetical protein